MMAVSSNRPATTTGHRLVFAAGLTVFVLFLGWVGIFGRRPNQQLSHHDVEFTDERLLELVTTTKRSSSDDDSLFLYEKVRPFWQAWKERYSYDDDDDDDDDANTNEDNGNVRLGIFIDNAHQVAIHNAAYRSGWTLYAQTIMHSPFSALTAAEFAASHLMAWQNCSATTKATTANENDKVGRRLRDVFALPEALPTHIDWRTRGIMTPVKNQKHCGSCWTFSTSGTLEAHTCLHNNKRNNNNLDCPTWTGLAEQQLLDCAWNYDNHGCNGGLPSHAFEYLKESGGMTTEAKYPYQAVDSHTCRMYGNITDKHHRNRAHVAAVYNISDRDENDLVAAVAHMGPVSIAYQVSPDFRFYSHGVYDSYNATSNTTICADDNMSVNHAVVAVGLGVTTDQDPPVPYYIVRNSWSAAWGMEGHFWMLRGQNLCGVSDCASFPLVPNSPWTTQWERHEEAALPSSSLLGRNKFTSRNEMTRHEAEN